MFIAEPFASVAEGGTGFPLASAPGAVLRDRACEVADA